MIDPDRGVLLVAVSGGPDSLALLLLAHAVLGERCLAATVDHGLRTESADEAGFVAKVCAERGIAHRTLTGDLAERAPRTANVSARARALRYRLLESHRLATAADAVATAHHADDQVETLMLRLNRGAGVGGLSGVRVRSQRVIRPLLGWRHAALVKIVVDAGITAIDDPSNRDDRYDRARLRKALESQSAIDVRRWGMSARALADADDALRWSVDLLAGQRCEFGEDWATFAPAGIPFELRRRLVERCIGHLKPGFAPRGETLARAVRALDAARPITLADIRCRIRTRGGAPLWAFDPAPARRLH